MEFDSPQTLAAFLDFILAIDKPELRHFVPVLENDGILPQDDPGFEDYLKKMGITPWTIPGDMRAYFLVKFQEDANWWENLPLDKRNDLIAKHPSLRRRPVMNLERLEKLSLDELDLFIQNLRVRLTKEDFSHPKNLFIRDVCLPILVALRQGQGLTAESWELLALAESRGFSRHEIETSINDAYDHFVRPVNNQQAAKYLGISPRHCRRVIARIAKFNGDARKSITKKHWLVPVSALDDWLLRHRLRLS
ncbi:MAG: helix-turn-helix domain-containing protein [Patescibacteria group bacterium]|nr:helix-turn-helix domain-containing protein [Patescibacteria group bacterium]